jgi:O-antigen/teichoic acid export membrane protein
LEKPVRPGRDARPPAVKLADLDDRDAATGQVSLTIDRRANRRGDPSRRGTEPGVQEAARKVIDRAREAVPEGTFAVGAGLLIAAVTAYVFVIIALRGLGNQSGAAFSTFWALIYVAGPGFFLPLEQEVGRALAHRYAQGIGGGPLVNRAARLGGVLTALLVVICIALIGPLSNGLFKGEALLVAGLAVGLIGFYSMHLTRGVLSGNGRFRAYGEMLGSEGIFRLGGAILLAVIGVKSAGAYALCLGLAPFAAVAFSLRRQRHLITPGPPAPYSELSENIGYLLGGSVLMQGLAYASLLGVSILEKHGDKARVASFARAFFIARIPVLMFLAVQAALLPKLAALASEGRQDDFRAGIRRLLGVVTGIAVIGTIAAATLGPFVGKILFGSDKFTIGNVDLGLLAAGSGVYIIALTFAQAVIALNGHAKSTLAWIAGVAVFVAVVAVVSDLFLRVELGFLIGSAASASLMAFFLVQLLRDGATASLEPLIEAIEQEPLEI